MVTTLASLWGDADFSGYLTVPTGMCVGGGFVYLQEEFLYRVRASGGTLERFSGGVRRAALRADDVNVYGGQNADTFTGWAPLVFVDSQTGGGASSFTTSTAAPTDIFVDANRFYWTDSAGSLTSMPIRGGTQTTTALPRTDPLSPLVLLDGRMFMDGCATVDVPSATGVTVAGYGMVADGSRCYELHGTCDRPYACGDLVSIPIGGGPMTVLAPASPPSSGEFDSSRMMIDAEGIYLLRDGPPTEMTYPRLPATLVRVPTGGGQPVDITTDEIVWAYDVTADTIYWASTDTQRGQAWPQIKSMPKYAP